MESSTSDRSLDQSHNTVSSTVTSPSVLSPSTSTPCTQALACSSSVIVRNVLSSSPTSCQKEEKYGDVELSVETTKNFIDDLSGLSSKPIDLPEDYGKVTGEDKNEDMEITESDLPQKLASEKLSGTDTTCSTVSASVDGDDTLPDDVSPLHATGPKAEVVPSDASSPKRNKRRKEEPKRVRPNAFIAVRVPSWSIRAKLENVQEEMVREEPLLGSSMVSLKKLHMTLMVLKLDTQEDEERAKHLLREVTERLKKEYSLRTNPLKLEFSGLGHFGDAVVFVKVKDGPMKQLLHKIADMVRESFIQGALPPTDPRPFQSHLTVAKLSAASPRDKRGLNYRIPPDAYTGFLEEGFGEQVIEGLELLSMIKPSDREGYYYCIEKYSFNTE